MNIIVFREKHDDLWPVRYFFFYNIRGRLQLTEDSANYVWYCDSRSKDITKLLYKMKFNEYFFFFHF
jgi:hypothetical protein